jgi:NAD(P)-dependent dehydrogenase (short-subunit alcohol dehydrogenase family)
MNRFDGKVAIVTGSTSGLGRAIALRLGSEGAAGVVVTGRDTGRGDQVQREVAATGAEVTFVRADLAEADAPSAVIDAADRRFGRIDVLVNAAGLSTRGSIMDTDVELFDQLTAINVRAPFFLIQGSARIMRREGAAGAIVNIGSVAAYGSLPVLAPYAVSKGALMTLTKNAAFALSRDRIRVNQLNIGWMDTPTEHTIQTEVHARPEDWLAHVEAEMPFARLLKPDEVARAVAFAASDDSGMMTGAIIDFDQSVVGGGSGPILDAADQP